MANESTLENNVASGFTGITTTTAYGILCAGTTATGAIQNAGIGTDTYILTSAGAGALPTWQPSGASAAAVCKVWATLDGSDVIALRDSFNIDSVSDEGVGIYKFTIDTDFASANYSITAKSSTLASSTSCVPLIDDYTYARTAGDFQVLNADYGSTPQPRDTDYLDIACYGDQ